MAQGRRGRYGRAAGLQRELAKQESIYGTALDEEEQNTQLENGDKPTTQDLIAWQRPKVIVFGGPLEAWKKK